MCLAIPACIKNINGEEGEVDFGSVSRTVSLIFTPEARVGDYVLIHAGYSMSVLSLKEAEDTLALFASMEENGNT